MIAQLDSIYKRFGSTIVLEDMNLEVGEEEIVCILGPSGCGKSTLLNIMSRLNTPDAGVVNVNIDKTGFVFQEDRLLPWKTVFENIRFVNKEANGKEIQEIINDMGLQGFENYFPHELSGGMKQRCSIARAFNYHSELLLMDEPFKSLDYSLRIKMIRQLISIWEHRKNSICFVTHEIDEALLLGSRIVILSNRPASVLKIFTIAKKQSERKLNSKELVDIRNEIIDLLLSTGNKD